MATTCDCWVQAVPPHMTDTPDGSSAYGLHGVHFNGCPHYDNNDADVYAALLLGSPSDPAIVAWRQGYAAGRRAGVAEERRKVNNWAEQVGWVGELTPDGAIGPFGLIPDLDFPEPCYCDGPEGSGGHHYFPAEGTVDKIVVQTVNNVGPYLQKWAPHWPKGTDPLHLPVAVSDGTTTYAQLNPRIYTETGVWDITVANPDHIKEAYQPPSQGGLDSNTRNTWRGDIEKTLTAYGLQKVTEPRVSKYGTYFDVIHSAPQLEPVGVATEEHDGAAVTPEKAIAWLTRTGWEQTGELDNLAQSWAQGPHLVVVPMMVTAPDYPLRWAEMLRQLSHLLGVTPQEVEQVILSGK